MIASQAVPIIAIAPVLVVWFGFGMLPKVLVIVLITFFPVTINTVDGLRAVDPEMLTLMRTMGATRWQVFRMVQLPSALPLVFSGMKIAAAVSVIGAGGVGGGERRARVSDHEIVGAVPDGAGIRRGAGAVGDGHRIVRRSVVG